MTVVIAHWIHSLAFQLLYSILFRSLSRSSHCHKGHLSVNSLPSDWVTTSAISTRKKTVRRLYNHFWCAVISCLTQNMHRQMTNYTKMHCACVNWLYYIISVYCKIDLFHLSTYTFIVSKGKFLWFIVIHSVWHLFYSVKLNKNIIYKLFFGKKISFGLQFFSIEN